MKTKMKRFNRKGLMLFFGLICIGTLLSSFVAGAVVSQITYSPSNKVTGNSHQKMVQGTVQLTVNGTSNPFDFNVGDLLILTATVNPISSTPVIVSFLYNSTLIGSGTVPANTASISATYDTSSLVATNTYLFSVTPTTIGTGN